MCIFQALIQCSHPHNAWSTTSEPSCIKHLRGVGQGCCTHSGELVSQACEAAVGHLTILLAVRGRRASEGNTEV